MRAAAALACLLGLAACGGGGGTSSGIGISTVESIGTLDQSGAYNAIAAAASNPPVSGSVSQSSLGSADTDTVDVTWDGGDYVTVESENGDVNLNSRDDLQIYRREWQENHRQYPRAPHHVRTDGTHEVDLYELVRNDEAAGELSLASVHVLWNDTDETDHVIVGYWFHATALHDSDNTKIDAGVFIDGTEFEPRDPETNPIPTTGTLRYSGYYGGVYSNGTSAARVVGETELVGTFGAGTTGTISGTVTFEDQSEGSLGGTQLKLAETNINPNGWVEPANVTLFDPLTEIETGTGKWGGQFSNQDYWDTGETRGVAGTAGVSWSGSGDDSDGLTGQDGAIIGVYLAPREH